MLFPAVTPLARYEDRAVARLSSVECAFALVAGLLIAHADLVRNAVFHGTSMSRAAGP